MKHEGIFPQIWAANSAELTRTTNACESFHSHFNKSFYHTHPSIFKTIEVLVEVQVESHFKLKNIEIPLKYQNLYSKKKRDFVQNKITEFNNNLISRINFVQSVSCYYYLQ